MQSLELKRTLEGNNKIASTLNNLGETYLALNQYTKSKECLDQALVIHLETENKFGEAIALNNLGKLYSAQGKYRQALSYLDQAKAIIDDQNLLEERMENLQVRLGVQEALQQLSQALLTSKRLSVVKRQPFE